MSLAKKINEADLLLVITGAGMGVDSGFATFRGEDGLWPAIEKKVKMPYMEWANPYEFYKNLELSWGFYGKRLENYRSVQPHEGYEILKRWSEKKNSFHFTTNVDGHALKTFDKDRVLENHGSLYLGQSGSGCEGVVDISNWDFQIDDEGMCKNIPHHKKWGFLRPAVLLFDDMHFSTEVYEEQASRYRDWFYNNRKAKKFVSIEIGCGDVIATGRWEARRHFHRFMDCTHIRINPCEEDPQKKSPPIHHIKMGALDGLKMLDKLIA